MSQLDMFGTAETTTSTVPSPDEVRRRLAAILSLLESAQELPWPEPEARRWKVVAPQMANWLPPDERDAVRARFAFHIERLERKAA